MATRIEEIFSQAFMNFKSLDSLINEFNKTINNLIKRANNLFYENKMKIEEIFKNQQESYQKLIQAYNYIHKKKSKTSKILIFVTKNLLLSLPNF